MLVGSSIIANAIMVDYNALGRREEETIRLRAEAEAMTRGATALKEAEARASKVLEETDADRSKLNKVVEELNADVQSRVAIIEEVSARATEAEARQGRLKRLLKPYFTRPRTQIPLMRLRSMRNECLSHVNPFYKSRFMDERSGFHGVYTKAAYAATVDAYNNLSNSAIEDIEKCLEAEDYVDSLRLLFDRQEEEDEAAGGGAKNDAGTSGTKLD
ncbi:hypothetical protein Hanom_Chr11g01014511 [Helianthus anomalus]